MTDKEILEKAIQKAFDNGWRPVVDGEILGVSENQFTHEWHICQKAPYTKRLLGQSVNSAVFSHYFAKALFPGFIDPISGEVYKNKPSGFETFVAWKYRLQQMVIADDPIKYLGEHLDG